MFTDSTCQHRLDCAPGFALIVYIIVIALSYDIYVELYTLLNLIWYQKAMYSPIILVDLVLNMLQVQVFEVQDLKTQGCGPKVNNEELYYYFCYVLSIFLLSFG